MKKQIILLSRTQPINTGLFAVQRRVQDNLRVSILHIANVYRGFNKIILHIANVYGLFEKSNEVEMTNEDKEMLLLLAGYRKLVLEVFDNQTMWLDQDGFGVPPKQLIYDSVTGNYFFMTKNQTYVFHGYIPEIPFTTDEALARVQGWQL